MAKRYLRKLSLLAKIETTYGTDAAPTGALNAVRAKDVTIEPMAGGEESRDLLYPWLGHQGVILTDQHVKLDFMVEMSGSGAAGTAPGYGPLLRGCGLAQTLNAGVSAVYALVSSSFEALTLYYNLDGVRHVVLGMRANVSAALDAQKIPHWKFSIVGLLGTVSDAALPAPTFTNFIAPVIVAKLNTSVSLHAYSGPAESFSFDLGNSVEPRLLMNAESVEITDRMATGNLVLEADTLAVKDWFSISRARTRGALSLIHGTAPGNIVTIAGPALEVGRVSHGGSQKILTYSLPLMFCPSAGNDELTITFS